jgi:Txe/YoeB family toxin of Txe-Axe toxin-antitoxin module
MRLSSDLFQDKVDVFLLIFKPRIAANLGGKILKLLHDIFMDRDAGKPERLKGNLSGWWSRRINQKRRLDYKKMKNLYTLLDVMAIMKKSKRQIVGVNQLIFCILFCAMDLCLASGI